MTQTPMIPPPGVEVPVVADDPAVRIATLEAELAKAQKDALLQRAEAENYRKRLQRTTDERVRHALFDFMGELLRVYDNLERADAFAGATGQLADGVRLTMVDLVSVMRAAGVELVPAEAGMPFDPNVHEAVDVEDNPTLAPGTIMATAQRGFTLHGRLLRPARVRVSRLPLAT